MKILMIGSLLTVNGGVQQYIRNLLLHMDLTRYPVDLLATPAPQGVASGREELEKAGVRILEMPDGDKARLPFYPGFFREHPDYDIIHMMTTSKINAVSACIIKACCPRAKLILHSHIVYPPMTLSWHIAHRLYQASGDYFLGCSVAAGQFVFGSRIHQKPNFAVACNAVDQTRFYANAAARSALRAEYGILPSQKLAGFVGRYNHQKRIPMILEIFSLLHQKDSAWRLMLVGGGEDQPQVDAKIRALGIGPWVIQAGVRTNVPDYYNAFDCFLMPSEFEGSPITLVEAQGCGLRCFASTSVPPDGAVTDLVQFLPEGSAPALWADTVQSAITPGDHPDAWPALTAAGYEQNAAAKAMQALYDSLVL